jgi:hypothetical protein
MSFFRYLVTPNPQQTEFFVIIERFEFLGSEGCLPIGSPIHVLQDPEVVEHMERLRRKGQTQPLEDTQSSQIMLHEFEAVVEFLFQVSESRLNECMNHESFD